MTAAPQLLGLDLSRHMVFVRAPARAFLGVSALLFAASAAVTIRLVRVHVGGHLRGQVCSDEWLTAVGDHAAASSQQPRTL